MSQKTARAGYAPACGNEWIRGICEKPRIKCAACLHQRFTPVTDETVKRHLCGQDDQGQEYVMGLYPMLRDETCYLVAVALEEANWPEHAKIFGEVCHDLNIPIAIERSRSGQSGRIWIFFSEPISATLAAQAWFSCAFGNDGAMPGDRPGLV